MNIYQNLSGKTEIISQCSAIFVFRTGHVTVLSTPPWKMEYSSVLRNRCFSIFDFALPLRSGRSKETKSPGPDNLSPKVLKELANEVGSLLLLIYKKSLQTNEIPEDWRKVNVAPVFTKQRTTGQYHSPVSAAK